VTITGKSFEFPAPDVPVLERIRSNLALYIFARSSV
jgi:hypothetical protein